jgi:hypothetical protein
MSLSAKIKEVNKFIDTKINQTPNEFIADKWKQFKINILKDINELVIKSINTGDYNIFQMNVIQKKNILVADILSQNTQNTVINILDIILIKGYNSDKNELIEKLRLGKIKSGIDNSKVIIYFYMLFITILDNWSQHKITTGELSLYNESIQIVGSHYNRNTDDICIDIKKIGNNNYTNNLFKSYKKILMKPDVENQELLSLLITFMGFYIGL